MAHGQFAFSLALPVLLIFTLGRAKFPSMTSEDGERMQFRTLIKELWFIGALTGIFLGGATELGMAQWLPAYAELALKYPQWVGEEQHSLPLAWNGYRAHGYWCSQRQADSYTIMALGCGISVVLFSAWLILFLSSACASCLHHGLTGSCLWGRPCWQLLRDRYPQGGATMFGALAAFGNAGGIFMLVLGGIADMSSLHWGDWLYQLWLRYLCYPLCWHWARIEGLCQIKPQNNYWAEST